MLSDLTIELTGFYPKQYYPQALRLVRYWDEEQNRELVFLTNATHISALQVAELYKNRWQILVLCIYALWVRSRAVFQVVEAAPQNQEILGYDWKRRKNPNTLYFVPKGHKYKAQVYSAICAYCLVAIVQKDMQLDRSTYEVLQILSISLTDKTHLRNLFDKTKFQNDKERFWLNKPNLFNF